MSNNFLDLANHTLSDLFDLLSEKNNDLEIDFIDKNITIEIDDGKTFIVSIHDPTKQIWLSSPLSGAHHFTLSNSNDLRSWISTRDNEINLFKILQEEIDEVINEH
tara:strand:+ start:44 stop:361 length:318 start_codon:yes stop_codon:yes gene_type:complete